MTVVHQEVPPLTQPQQRHSGFAHVFDWVVDWMYRTPNPQARAFFDREHVVNALISTSEIHSGVAQHGTVVVNVAAMYAADAQLRIVTPTCSACGMPVPCGEAHEDAPIAEPTR